MVLRTALQKARRFLQAATFIIFNFAKARHATAELREARRLGFTSSRDDIRYLRSMLVADMSPRARCDVLVYHYRFLKAATDALGTNPFGHGRTLWSSLDQFGNNNRISFSYFDDRSLEGEIELSFAVEDTVLTKLRFTIAPGGVFGSEDPLLLIGSVQGSAGASSHIRAAAKAHHEVTPALMLVLSAKAMAKFIGIRRMAGVENSRQVGVVHHPTDFFFDYDRFWREINASRTEFGVFEFPVDDDPHRPIRSRNRSRTRRKRQFKRELVEQIFGDLQASNGRPDAIERERWKRVASRR